MFTGIVQGVAKLISIVDKPNFRTHIVEFPQALLPGLALGASVSNNGCCLTVTKINGVTVSFDLMKETLQTTNLGELTVGDLINVERSAKVSDEVGGHLMSGHVICTAEITDIILTDNNHEVWFCLPEQFTKYVLHKGFIGIDGISLTIGEVKQNCFCVYLIPETLNRTTLGSKKMMDSVNIEIDSKTQSIVDTVERILAAKFDKM